MVDLTRDSCGNTRARLLDLVPGRSGKAYAGWLGERGDTFRRNVKVAALDPFAGYKTAIDDKLQDATAVLDAFHVVKLGTAALDEVRCRVQQDTLGHRSRKGDPLYGIQTILRTGQGNLTERNEPASLPRSTQTLRTRKCSSPGSAPSNSAPPTRRRTWPTGDGSRRRSSSPSTPARSPSSRASAAPFAAGRQRSLTLHHQPLEQRRHRGRERHHRTTPTPRPRVPQPRQLPTTRAARRRRTHPMPPTGCPKSRKTRPIELHGQVASNTTCHASRRLHDLRKNRVNLNDSDSLRTSSNATASRTESTRTRSNVSGCSSTGGVQIPPSPPKTSPASCDLVSFAFVVSARFTQSWLCADLEEDGCPTC